MENEKLFCRVTLRVLSNFNQWAEPQLTGIIKEPIITKIYGAHNGKLSGYEYVILQI
jgi:hypothetical protein